MKPQRPYLLLAVLAVFLFFARAAPGENGSFREDFIRNHTHNKFQAQVILVRENSAVIPSEVRLLARDAMTDGRPANEKMRLLDIAQAMASMHKHWNNDAAPLTYIEAKIKVEIKIAAMEEAALKRWDKYEKFVGNFVMKTREPQMAEEGLGPVIYPHWIHRVWFKCKVCHQGIFKMKRSGNGLSQARILEGKQCGVCHNNRIAFGADKPEHCVKCHSAGEPEADHLGDMEKVDHKRLKEVADRLGAKWDRTRLAGGNMPLDRFGNIDWLKLKKNEAFSPITSLDKDYKDKVSKTDILFESINSSIDFVMFSHSVHSTWIKCDTCHPTIFKAKLGANNVRIKDLAEGRFCGYCHGKVSFALADCMRCHNHPRDKPAGGALIHKVTPF